MKKTMLLIAVLCLLAAVAGAQCATSLTSVGSGVAPGLKCYGTIDTYNAMANRGGFYYDYEYSAFTKSPIACETPTINTDVVQFFGRTRNWGNNGACATLYGCPTPVVGSDTVYATWATNANNFLSYFIMESCPFGATSYGCAGTGLPTRVVGVSCNGTNTGVDRTFHPAAPTLTNVSGCSAAGGNRTCTFAISIAGPTAGTGLYGSDGISMISGYRIYAAPGAAMPTSGAVAGWTATANYVPYAGATSTLSFPYTWPDTTNIYFAYAPIFNNRALTPIATLAANGLTTTGFVSPAGGYEPTPATFTSFSAQYADLQHVNAAWVTASETDAVGFNLYRSLDGATWVKVNAGIIPAKGVGGAGSSYAYTDNLPRQRVYQPWKYKVEEMSNTNERIAETTTEATK